MEPEENEYSTIKSSEHVNNPVKNAQFTLNDSESTGQANMLADKVVILLIG